jgi:hypothetical protein
MGCFRMQAPETKGPSRFSQGSRARSAGIPLSSNCRGSHKIGHVRNPLATMLFVKRISRIGEAIALLGSCTTRAGSVVQIRSYIRSRSLPRGFIYFENKHVGLLEDDDFFPSHVDTTWILIVAVYFPGHCEGSTQRTTFRELPLRAALTEKPCVVELFRNLDASSGLRAHAMPCATRYFCTPSL